jgi:hypothetical protein
MVDSWFNNGMQVKWLARTHTMLITLHDININITITIMFLGMVVTVARQRPRVRMCLCECDISDLIPPAGFTSVSLNPPLLAVNSPSTLGSTRRLNPPRSGAEFTPVSLNLPLLAVNCHQGARGG